MKKIYSADSLPMAGYVQSILESLDIECVLKNQNLSGAMGELPPIECWPEVWIINDDDFNQAIQIVNSAIHSSTHAKDSWQCNCGEIIEGQFSACWSCGAERAD
jgi:hypothetical protein